MRILDEKQLSVVWSWGQAERLELTQRFRENLGRLRQLVGQDSGRETVLSASDLEGLANELQEAGQLMEESRQRCFALSESLHVLAGGDETERRQRAAHLQAMKQAVGRPVELRNSGNRVFEGRPLVLEAIRGIDGVVRSGEERWQISLFKLRARA